MSLTRFVKLKSLLTLPQVQRGLLLANRYPSALSGITRRLKSTKDPPPDEIDINEPIKFSTSRAATWKATETYGGSKDQKPLWYEPYVVSLSLVVFLLYFCVFREESGVDLKLNKTLYDHIEGLEEKQLELSLKHNLETGRNTQAIEQRLAELQSQRENSDE